MDARRTVRAVAMVAMCAPLLVGCHQGSKTVTETVPAPTPSALKDLPDASNADALSRYFVQQVGTIDPASNTSTTRINQMKNAYVVQPDSKTCSEGPFTPDDMSNFRANGVAELKPTGDIQDVSDDPIDEPTHFSHAYQFTLQAVDSHGKVVPTVMQKGSITLIAYLDVRRNDEQDKFRVVDCSFGDGK